MRTLILIPTETEAAPLRAACPDAPVRIAGVGMAAAAAATARIIAEEHPDRLILAGIAGASDRSVAVCEVVAVAGERIAELPGKIRRPLCGRLHSGRIADRRKQYDQPHGSRSVRHAN